MNTSSDVNCGKDCALMTGAACIQEIHLVPVSAPMQIFTVNDAVLVFLLKHLLYCI